MTNQDLIRAAYAGDAEVESARAAVESAIDSLDRGESRVAEKTEGGWVVNEWLKEAILLYFRLREMETVEVGA